MRRIRTIKPELIEDERTAALTHEEFRLFVSMIVIADDYGNLRANASYLNGLVFWARESESGVDQILAGLSHANLVTLYSIRGQRYAHLNGWTKHQRVDKPGKARVPSEKDSEAVEINCEKDTAKIRESFANNSGTIREPFATDLGPRTEDLEEEQDQDRGPGAVVAPQKTASLASPVILEFPCTGSGPKTWGLTKAYFESLQADYDTIDVLFELKKLRQRVLADSTERKTFKGYPKRVVNWLNRAVEFGSRKPPGGARQTKTAAEQSMDRIRDAVLEADEAEPQQDMGFEKVEEPQSSGVYRIPSRISEYRGGCA